jgi:hypothetical protein
MLGFLRIVWTSALTGLDKKILGFQDGWTLNFLRIGFGRFFRTLAFQDSGFQVFRILGFRFSLGIVALTKQRCNTFLVDTMLFRPLVAYCR